MPHIATLRAAASRRRVRLAVLSLLAVLAPTSANSQSRGCPQFARVPGYGACTNIAGTRCGFCTYRCNDETVVRWNVCAI
jgi:hypothetical protein